MNMDRDDKPKDRGPRSVTRLLDLLLLLASKADSQTLAELSQELAIPKSTLLGTLRGLCESHYLEREEGRYRLGSRSFHLASQIVANWSAPDIVRQQVRALARETGESVGFAIADWDIGQAIYTEAVNSRQPVHYAMRAGIRAPLYASAAGRVLLAHASPHRLDNYLTHTRLKALTGKTRTDSAAIRAHLDDIRNAGHCASFGEMLKDTAALAVPVLETNGRIIGAMMLAAPLERMRNNYEALLAALIRAGQNASGSAEGS